MTPTSHSPVHQNLSSFLLLHAFFADSVKWKSPKKAEKLFTKICKIPECGPTSVDGELKKGKFRFNPQITFLKGKKVFQR
jgi:hypothetical protein